MTPQMLQALAKIAPGRPLREGLDRILQASKGALVIVGDGPDVLEICSGGFLLDAEFSPQRTGRNSERAERKPRRTERGPERFWPPHRLG